MLIGGDEQLLSVYNVGSGSEELCIPINGAIKCVWATPFALICASGTGAIMYGKGSCHYGWQDQPSFTMVAELMQAAWCTLFFVDYSRPFSIVADLMQPWL